MSIKETVIMGKFYFCNAGMEENPCNRKYQTAKNWINHMENPEIPLLREHNKIEAKLDRLKEYFLVKFLVEIYKKN